MSLKWTDTLEIGIALAEKYPGVNPEQILFTDLWEKVCALEDFDDNPQHGGEKILEAIQMAWIEEKD